MPRGDAGRRGPGGEGREPGDWVLPTLSGLVVAASALLLLTYSYGRDQAGFAVIGRTILSGGMPYRDAWDLKPPGTPLVYALALALFGKGQLGIRLLESAGLLAMVAAMTRVTRSFWGDSRIGLVAGALALLLHVQLDFWNTAQGESFGGVLIVAALAAAPGVRGGRLLEPDRVRLSAWALQGSLWGVCALLKPTMSAGVVVVLGASTWAAFSTALARGSVLEAAREALRKALRPCAVSLAGFLIPLAACAAWLASGKVLGEFLEILFVFNPHYTALAWQGQGLGPLVVRTFTEWVQGYSLLLPLAIVILPLWGRASDVRGIAIVGALLATQLAGVAAQGKLFPYHFGAVWPLTALLAGLGLVRAWEAASRRGLPSRLLVLAVAVGAGWLKSATRSLPEPFLDRTARRVALVAGGFRDQAAIDSLASAGDVNMAANREVARFLAERTAPGRTVLVYGFEPVIYLLSDRAPASRYFYDMAQRVSWGRERSRAALLDDLSRTPAQAIVVVHRDVLPWVTGNDEDSAGSLRSFAGLRLLLESRYRLAAQIEDLDVYLENPPRAENARTRPDVPGSSRARRTAEREEPCHHES